MKRIRVLYSLVVSFTLSQSAIAVVGINHIHDFEGSFAIDQEYEDSVGAVGGPGGRDYTGITFSVSPFDVIDGTALMATIAAFGVSGLPATHQFKFEGPFLDESVDTFVVDAGDRFSRGSILGGEFYELVWAQTYYLPQDFYLGVLTPSRELDGPIVSQPPFDPAFGWLRIQNTNGVLSLVDHAIAYDSEGIVVGSTTAIPEPEISVFLFLVGFAAITNRRRLTNQ
ncbi:MAG: hypothetical protein Q7Q71_13255 [Verrucomicrobiota bacterium JB023]|nr:hypothetical protein [Verrucomicrobiota bacterium JB023]